jgi:hypothetical protein
MATKKKSGPSNTPSANAAKKPATKTAAQPPRREDRPGHFDPKYAAALRALSGAAGKDDARAFVGKRRSRDDLAEELAEEAVVAMTTGEDGLGDDLQASVAEDVGGPFVASTAGKEFAEGTDASNPSTSTKEPFPRT